MKWTLGLIFSLFLLGPASGQSITDILAACPNLSTRISCLQQSGVPIDLLSALTGNLNLDPLFQPFLNQLNACGTLTHQASLEQCLIELAGDTTCISNPGFQTLINSYLDTISTNPNDVTRQLMASAVIRMTTPGTVSQTFNLFRSCDPACTNLNGIKTGLAGCGTTFSTYSCTCVEGVTNGCPLVEFLLSQENPNLALPCDNPTPPPTVSTPPTTTPPPGVVPTTAAPPPATGNCDVTLAISQLTCINTALAGTGVQVDLTNIGASFIAVIFQITTTCDGQAQLPGFFQCYRDLLDVCGTVGLQLATDSIPPNLSTAEKIVIQFILGRVFDRDLLERIANLAYAFPCDERCRMHLDPSSGFADDLATCVGATPDVPIPTNIIANVLANECGKAVDTFIECLIQTLGECPFVDEFTQVIFGLPPAVGVASLFIPTCGIPEPAEGTCNYLQHAACLAQGIPSSFNIANPMTLTNAIMTNTQAFCSVKEQFKLDIILGCLRDFVADCAGTLDPQNAVGLLGPISSLGNTNGAQAIAMIPEVVRQVFNDACDPRCVTVLDQGLTDPTPCLEAAANGMQAVFNPVFDPTDVTCNQVGEMYKCVLESFRECPMMQNILANAEAFTGISSSPATLVPVCSVLVKQLVGTCDIRKLTNCVQASIPEEIAFRVTDATQFMSLVSDNYRQFCHVMKGWDLAGVKDCYREFFATCGGAANTLGFFLGDLYNIVATQGPIVSFTLNTVFDVLDALENSLCTSECAQFFYSGSFDPSQCITLSVGALDLSQIILAASGDYTVVETACNLILSCIQTSTGGCQFFNELVSVVTGNQVEPPCTSIVRGILSGRFNFNFNVEPAAYCQTEAVQTCLSDVGITELTMTNLLGGAVGSTVPFLFADQNTLCSADIQKVATCVRNFVATCGYELQRPLASLGVQDIMTRMIHTVAYNPSGDFWDQFACSLCSGDCNDFDLRYEALWTCASQNGIGSAIEQLVSFQGNAIDHCTKVQATIDCWQQHVGTCGALASMVYRILSTPIPDGVLFLPCAVSGQELIIPDFGFAMDSCSAPSTSLCLAQQFAQCAPILTQIISTPLSSSFLDNINTICSIAENYAKCVVEKAETCSAQLATDNVLYYKNLLDETLKAFGIQPGGCVAVDFNVVPQAITGDKPLIKPIPPGSTATGITVGHILLTVCMALLAALKLV